MSWLQITLICNSKQIEAAEQAMQDSGANAITLRDGEDQPLLEPAPGETPLWDVIKVTGLYPADIDAHTIIKQLKDALPWAAETTFLVDQLEDQPWERVWLEHFKPLRMADNLWVVPSGYDAPDKKAVNIILDPGLAFGTGTHPTTALCLQWLAEQDLQDKIVIDYGCGSGILGIAAALRGAKQVYCVDLDPQALTATRHNAERNQLDEKQIATYLPKQLPNDIKADVLIANILAGPLAALADTFKQHLKPDGRIALSGILDSQAEEVQAVYAQWCDMEPMARSENWMRLSGSRLAEK